MWEHSHLQIRKVDRKRPHPHHPEVHKTSQSDLILLMVDVQKDRTIRQEGKDQELQKQTNKKDTNNLKDPTDESRFRC